jgi:hypothetical protein
VDGGGGPERDDYGLPRVDVEIPDDARELEPDVQAYRRELRAHRRQQRANRLRRPLNREGVALPLLAACLMLALITSTLLVLFAADETGMPQLPRPGATSRPSADRIGQPLPAAQIIIGSRSESVQTITAHQPSLLALVPRDCNCASELEQLAAQASGAHVALYLIGTSGDMSQVRQLATEAGQSSGVVGEDAAGVLATGYRESGLTALLVQAGGSVAYVARSLGQPKDLAPLESELRQLSPVAVGR